MKLFSYKHRLPHLGPYPLERLKRAHDIPQYKKLDAVLSPEYRQECKSESLSSAMNEYINLLDRLSDGETTSRKAPIPEDPLERAHHFKAACYYLDASQVSTCVLSENNILQIPIRNSATKADVKVEYSVGASKNAMSSSIAEAGTSAAWKNRQTDDPGIAHHTHALILLVEYTREPDASEPGELWLLGTQAQRAGLRASEAAVVIAQYMRLLGFSARAHSATNSDVDSDSLLLASGLGELSESGGKSRITNPYLGADFGVAIVTTEMELRADEPLAARNLADKWRSHGPGWWLGIGGTKSWLQGKPYKNRPFHMGLHPLEKIKTKDEPSTYIDTPNVPRLPKRHDMFIRAALGDLGDKAAKAMANFRMNKRAPIAHAMMLLLGAMVPMQYGKKAPRPLAGTDDPDTNAKSIKAALNYLGADMVGICEIPDYAWYSHDHDGSEIKPYHKNAITVLINQGHETMDGASGDDWIGSAQGMRAYMRSTLISGIVAAHIRKLGYSARTHSVIDGDMLQIPLILLSGLGELGRLGEVVLNPFIGPSSKSSVITTDMPLSADRPIDFGLQDFCEQCNKCARECPCNAIPFGGKIMFNAYEMWKPDMVKCAHYRATNAGGTMCGRCTKTCPWNLEGVLVERPFLWAAINLPFTRRWIAKFDDKVGNGEINPVKKWWWDLDMDDEENIIVGKRTNERPLFFRPSIDTDKQVLGCYPAEDAPPANHEGISPVDRKLAVKRYQQSKTPQQYRARSEQKQ